MHYTKKITEDIIWTGASDRRITLFEGLYPVNDGMAYNSYLIKDEKTVLVDTCDKAVSGQFFENVEAALGGRELDYVIVQHMEPDHSATLGELVLRYPGVKIVTNAKSINMIKQFFDFDIDSRAVPVGEGDELDIGSRKLSFIAAPMVHWPEVIMTYDPKSKAFFSADAFGSFGSIDGSIWADSKDYILYVGEARRYYTNIVGKYGAQVQAVLKKASSLDIEMLLPLHGLVWRKDLDLILGSYDKWSSFTAEDDGAAVLYASIYGNSAAVADIIAGKIADQGKKVTVVDCNMKQHSYAVSAAFRHKNIVIVSPTTDGGIMSSMEDVVHAIAAHNLQNREVFVVENGTWAPVVRRKVTELFGGLKNVNVSEASFAFRSSLKEDGIEPLERLVEAICG